MAINGNFKIYQDPTIKASRKNRKKDIFNLEWLDVAWFCDIGGKALTVKELSNPNCMPVIRTLAIAKSNNSNFINDGYDFIYDPYTEVILIKLVRGAEFQRLKPHKAQYKHVLAYVKNLTPKPWSDKLRIKLAKYKGLAGFKGKSILSSGYFYAPYVPLMTTPSITNIVQQANKLFKKYNKKI